MAELSIGKLEKMEFHFFSDSAMSGEPKSKHIVMYNPKELKLEYQNSFDKGSAIQNGTVGQKFKNRNPRKMTVNLMFDGTGASPSSSPLSSLGQTISGVLNKEAKDIHAQIKKFLGEATEVNGEAHQPLYVMAIWGKLHFPAVITTASVTYKLFKNDGTPLRATVTVGLLEHLDEIKYKSHAKLLSPDLTRAHVIVNGDRLDALCNKYYGDSSLYHEVAKVNNLTNTRKLVPGNTLVFPPIDKRN